MGGYNFHRSTASGNLSPEFIAGLFAPDIMKKWYKIWGLDGAYKKYNMIRTDKMPEFEEFSERVQQQEVCGKADGMHYGKSSLPNIMAFWNGLTKKQRENAFYKGYVWHLLGDALMYKRLDIDAKFLEFKKANKDKPNFEALRKAEVEKLHDDWDKTNVLIRDSYPDVVLPDWVTELGVVKYLTKGTLVYVNWSVLKDTIDYLRQFNPMSDDMENIIETVIKKIQA